MNSSTSIEETQPLNNNDKYSSGTGVRKKEIDINANRRQQNTDINANSGRRKNYYHSNYQEALRSLLWDPYDCREENIYENYLQEENNTCRNINRRCSSLKRQQSISSSDSSLSLSSSCSSLDEILTVEMTNNEPGKISYSSKTIKKLQNCAFNKTIHRNSLKDEKMEIFCDINKRISWPLRDIKTDWLESASASASKNKANDEMVNDLNQQTSYQEQPLGALVVDAIEKYAIEHQSESGFQCVDADVSCTVDSSVSDEAIADVSSDTMLVTVAGSDTLEPRDTNEGTHLVSPDSSLDLVTNNETPGRIRNRLVPQIENRLVPQSDNRLVSQYNNDNRIVSQSNNDNRVVVTSTSTSLTGNNVSVVNCYRAVPVAVVSTVPTIQCLNTQQNVSNVNIIQTSSAEPQTATSTIRRTSPNDVGLPKTVPPQPRTRVQVPNLIKPRLQPRNVPQRAVPQRPITQRPRSQEIQALRNKTKLERERPKSSNVLNTHDSSVATTSADKHENHLEGPKTSLRALTVHNRSVSNPVIGVHPPNRPQPPPPHPPNARYASHQNLVEAETPRSYPQIIRNEPAPEAGPQTPVSKDTAPSSQNETPKPSPRTFISTEAQTDDIGVPITVPLRSVASREQRRRERRERRHQRRLQNQSLNVLSGNSGIWPTDSTQVDRLPDILNAHLPPPYTMPGTVPPPPPITPYMPPPLPLLAAPTPHMIEPQPGSPIHPDNGSPRFTFAFHGSGRTRSRRSPRGQTYTPDDDTPKSCCGVMVNQTVSIRWFIVMIAFVGICCVIVGTVLGAMKASGREHLTVSLLMIGVGIVLVTVSGVAWRLTSHDAPSCRSMLGLGGNDEPGTEPNRRFVPRMPPSYGRPHHPYAAMMYPEFQYRPPPPSYQASMQEYRLRLLLLERPNGTTLGHQHNLVSPPPTYRSQSGISTLGLRAAGMCRSQPQSEYSHPPSYRSRTSSTRPTLDPNGMSSVNHSRDPSLISHVSDQNVTQAVVNVISVMSNGVDIHATDTDLPLDAIKIGVEEDVPIPPLRMLLNKSKKSSPTPSDQTKSENVNLVTIVSVSDPHSGTTSREHSVESDILAHL